MPQRGATRSGANARDRAAHVVDAVASTRRGGPSRTSPSANSVCTMPASSSASVPGRIEMCSSAIAAVSLRRGSITTSLPPRSRMRRARPRKSGTVHRLPFEAIGFAPSMSR